MDRARLFPRRRLHPGAGATFLGCHHEKVRRAVRALVAQGVAAEEHSPGIDGIGRVCRIHGRAIYKALGAGNHRRRRITSAEVLMRRLLALDYVLEHPPPASAATEAEKAAAFEAPGIERRILPQRVYRGALGNLRRFFPLGLPVALDAERAVFVYADPGHGTTTDSWGAAHRELRSLPRRVYPSRRVISKSPRAAFSSKPISTAI